MAVLPTVIAIVGILMLLGKKNYFSAFIEGTSSGIRSCIRLLPTFCALIVAVNMLNASGAIDFLSDIANPWLSKIGVPGEILALILTRPVSGSASTAAYSELIEKSGADSFAVLCASIIMGSSDTLIYVISVYFSSVGLKKSRHSYICALITMIFCIFFSCLIARLWFNR